MNGIDLKKEFEWCRENFFPRWHGGADWKVIDAAGWTEQVWPIFWKNNILGYCWTEAKQIFINLKAFRRGDKDRIRATLIHEVSHIFAPDHKERFQCRLKRAIRQAGQIEGGRRLARILEGDLAYCKQIIWEANLPLIGAIYGEIAAYGRDHLYLSFAEVVCDLFGEDFTASYIRRCYPQAISHFRRARKRRRRLSKLWPLESCISIQAAQNVEGR